MCVCGGVATVTEEQESTWALAGGWDPQAQDQENLSAVLTSRGLNLNPGIDLQTGLVLPRLQKTQVLK